MALAVLTNRIPPFFSVKLTWVITKCVLYFISIGNYPETVNDAKVAIELQPHFSKAFVRGKSFNSYKTLKSFVSDTTDVEDTNLERMVYCRGVGRGGAEDFFGGSQISFGKGQTGICQNFWQTKRGGCNFFSPLIKKGSIIFWIFLIKKGYSNYSMLEDSFLACFINNSSRDFHY